MESSNNLDLFEKINKLEVERCMPDLPLIISEEDTENDDLLKYLKRAYESEENYSLVKRVVASVLCYMRTRNKIVFPISSGRMKVIYQGDPNWKNKIPFEEAAYNTVLGMLSDLGIKRIVMSRDKKPGIVFAFEGSPTAKYFTGKLEDELCELFKTFQITENDFVDGTTKKAFQRFLTK